MSLFAQFRSLAASLLRRRRLEASMHDEIRFHIDAYADDLVKSGVARSEAQRRARIEFGGAHHESGRNTAKRGGGPSPLVGRSRSPGEWRSGCDLGSRGHAESDERPGPGRADRGCRRPSPLRT